MTRLLDEKINKIENGDIQELLRASSPDWSQGLEFYTNGAKEKLADIVLEYEERIRELEKVR